VGTDKASVAYADGTLQCVVSRSEGFLFLNSATASSIAVSTTQQRIYHARPASQTVQLIITGWLVVDLQGNFHNRPVASWPHSE